MKKCWIGLLALTLLGTGCRTVETVGGNKKKCFTDSCVQEVQQQVAEAQDRIKQKEVAREEQERQEREAKLAEEIRQDPWKAYTIEQVKELASKNKFALVYIQRRENGLLAVSGIDLASLQSSANIYGWPMITARIDWNPVRDKMTPHTAMFGQTTYKALCQHGVLIDPAGRQTDMTALLRLKEQINATDDKFYPDTIRMWKIMCSFGSVIPAPFLL